MTDAVTSSPKSNNNHGGENTNDLPRGKKPEKIKLLIVNCRSLKSDRKQHDLLDLIETHKPDVICGQESHIDSTLKTAEVFPNEYNVSRKDRNIHGGGVFVAVTKRYVSTTEYSLDTKCEVLWCKITVAGTKPLYIASYYRPTDEKPEPIQQLQLSIGKISKNGTLPNVILAGDFNLPDINWPSHTIKPNPQYGYKVNRALLDTVEDHGLIQQVHKPTRLNNILDLLFTTNPDLVDMVEVYPGMSDHSIVTAVINVKAKRNIQPPRKVFVYKKMNTNGLRSDMRDLQQTFLVNNERSANENWLHLGEKSMVQPWLTMVKPWLNHAFNHGWWPWLTMVNHRFVNWHLSLTKVGNHG